MENQNYVTAGTLIKEFYPEPYFLIEGILPSQGVTMCSGMPSSYKTWVYIHFIASILKGSPVFGLYKTNPVNIILVNIDDYLPQIKKRLIMAQINDEQENLAVISKKASFKITNTEDKQELKDEIIKNNAKLIVIDTLKQCHDVDENKAELMSEIMANFKEIASELDCAILLIHHDGKETFGKTAITSASGSVVIIGNCVASFRLKPAEQKNHVIMEGGKNKLGYVFKKTVLEFHPDVPGEQMFAEVEVQKAESLEELKNNIIDVYKFNPEPKLIMKDFITEYRNNHITTSKAKIEKALIELKNDGILGYKIGLKGRKEFYLINTEKV